MAIFQAFRALRPVSEKAADMAALPYDVVDRAEAKAIGDKNPDSFLHVDRAEMDLPDDTDLYDSKVYERARQNLLNMEKNGVMKQDAIIFMNLPVRERHRQVWLDAVQSMII